MMKMLNKFGVFIIIGVVGYLAYSAVNRAKPAAVNQTKEIPVISKKMLSPVFIEPANHGHTARKDPFDVSWDSYFEDSSSATGQLDDQPGNDDNRANSQQKLMGILNGSDGQQLALIDGEVYGIGSFIRVSDSNEMWLVNSINEDSVVLTYNGLQTILRIDGDSNDNSDMQSDIAEAEVNKEPQQ